MSALKTLRGLILLAVATVALQRVAAQNEHAHAATSGVLDAAKVIKSAADALGMPRNGAEGGGALPEIDVINRMQFWGSGTAYIDGQARQIDYHGAVSYNPPGMRVEIARKDGGGHTFQVVRENYAWDETELGGGLVPGRGTATPVMSAVKERFLQIWILPYGAVKAAYNAGDAVKVATANGQTLIAFPLGGELAGVTETATLDSRNLVIKVETRTDNPALKGLEIEAEYSDYADHGEVQTDIQTPRHVIEKQGGHTVLAIEIGKWNADNPYVAFPIPASVRKTF